MKEKFYDLLEKRNNDDEDVRVSFYNNEWGTLEAYNGRQLLELLQNIDDQESEEALIKLDTKNQVLIIANKGKAFSEGGLRSLMVPNRSSKGNTFIGNKGLGFRSLLNWSGKIYVKSSNILSIEFSEENRDILEPTRERAILTAPRWIEGDNKPEWIERIDPLNDYVTYVAVSYTKESEKDILEQIKKISEELMFFINHIKEIHIEKGEERETFRKKDWKVGTKSGEIPERFRKSKKDNKNYELKLVLPPKGESVNSLLFSYFPTNIKIDFPALIHGTFELDPTRNAIVYNSKNGYIVEKLAEFIIETAEDLKSEDANWETYEFVDFDEKNNNVVLEKFGFYKIIEEWKKTAKIYPCIDNKYRSKDSWAFYTNDFSDFMESYTEVTGKILKRNKHINSYKRSFEDLDRLVNKVSEKIRTIPERVKFIDILLIMSNKARLDKDKISILANQDNKLRKDLFFYDNIFEGLKIPDFIEIDYIHPKLQKGIGRDRISRLANVKEFDIDKDLIGRIIESNESIQAKLRSLYSIFVADREFGKKLKGFDGITGKYIRDERILAILDEEEIVEEYENLGIDDLQRKEDFLRWLGAKPFNAREVLKKVIEMNQKKINIPKNLKSLMILMGELNEYWEINLERKDICIYDANIEVRKAKDLFPYQENQGKEMFSACKEDLGLKEYPDEKVEELLKWLGVKEYNPGNLALEKIKQLKNRDLSEDRVKSILKFLYISKSNGELNEINPSEADIYILGKLAKNLKLRREFTEKYFFKDELIDGYSYLGLEKSEVASEFLEWLGVEKASDDAIVNRIFESGSSINIKIKDLFSIFSKNEKVKPPKMNFKLKSLVGEICNARDLYFNDSISKFFEPKNIIGDLDIKVSREFLEWLGVSEPKREDFVSRLIELLSKKGGISLELRKEAISELSKQYDGSDELPEEGLFLIDSQNNIKISSQIYKETVVAKKHIPTKLINSELELEDSFLEWIGIKEADSLMIMVILLKMPDPNLKDIYDIWREGRYGKLDDNIEVKIKNRMGIKTSTDKLFLQKKETPFYKNYELVGEFSDLELDDTDTEKVERFLTWLGVNKYIKYQETEKGKEIYRLKEISSLKFSALISLLEKENILRNRGALRYLQNAFPDYKYWILDDKNIPLINPPVDYKTNPNRLKLLQEFEIKSDFNENNSLFLLQKLEEIDSKGEYAPQIYKELVKYNFDYSEDFKVFTKDKKYTESNNLYYLSNIRAPKSIRDGYSFIDLPLSLNSSSVVSTFKVQRLPEFKFSVEKFQDGDVSKQLNKYLNSLNPYFLAFGSNEMEANEKKETAFKLKNLKIKVGSFKCIMGSEVVDVENYEMVGYEDGFYIKIEDLENDFNKNLNMTVSIQNIILTLFNEKYREKIANIFRNADFEYLKKELEDQYGSNVLKEAEDLLKGTIYSHERSENLNSHNNFIDEDLEEESFKEDKDDFTEKEKYGKSSSVSTKKRKMTNTKENNSYNHTRNNKVLKSLEEDSSDKTINDEGSLWVKENHQEEIILQKLSSKNKKSLGADCALDDINYSTFVGEVLDAGERKTTLQNKNSDIQRDHIVVSKYDMENGYQKGYSKGNLFTSSYSLGAGRNLKEEAGGQAEAIVNKLFSDYKWVSGYAGGDDHLGYDFEYTIKNEKHFVEVKNFNKKHFYLTENEMRVAIEKGVKYHIYLVDYYSIYDIGNPFIEGNKIYSRN